jgi:flagellar hook-basal body complex protein FliE
MNPISFQPTLPNPVSDTKGVKPSSESPAEKAFGQMLDQSIGNVNRLQNEANTAISDLTTGKRADIHQTMVAVEKASIAFELMLQIRNKIVTAYETVMRTSV